MVDRYREQMAKDFPEADTVFSIAALTIKNPQ